jgi:hypothetical protein
MPFDIQAFKLHCAIEHGDTDYVRNLDKSGEELTPMTRQMLDDWYSGKYKKKRGRKRDGLKKLTVFFRMAELINSGINRSRRIIVTAEQLAEYERHLADNADRIAEADEALLRGLPD